MKSQLLLGAAIGALIGSGAALTWAAAAQETPAPVVTGDYAVSSSSLATVNTGIAWIVNTTNGKGRACRAGLNTTGGLVITCTALPATPLP